MKNVKSNKIVLIVLIMLLLMLAATNVFATGNSGDIIQINITTNPSTNTATPTNTTTNTVTTNTVTNIATNVAVPITNTAGSTYTNATQNANTLPQTGDASDYAIFLLIAISIVIAVYAYKKVRDYNIK